jgi:MYXO-CTERM domain-containing protein
MKCGVYRAKEENEMSAWNRIASGTKVRQRHTRFAAWVLPAACLAAASVGFSVRADVIWDNGAPAEPPSGQIQSEENADGDFTEIADDFVLSSAFPNWEISGVHIIGQSSTALDSDWRIRLYDDVGGAPALTPFYSALMPATSMTPNGLWEGQGFDVSFDIAPVTVAPGSYFISVVNLTGLSGQDGLGRWFWGFSQTSQGSEAHVDSTVFGIPRWTSFADVGFPNTDVSFSLTGNGIPEPASALLLALGALPLLRRRRRA